MKRLKPKERKAQILEAALACAILKNYKSVTREDIAHQAGVSEALINVYFGTMTKLRRAIIRAAINREYLPIILQGLVNKDPHAMKISDALKKHVLNSAL
jgi:AcrR family transcriptional regulator